MVSEKHTQHVHVRDGLCSDHHRSMGGLRLQSVFFCPITAISVDGGTNEDGSAKPAISYLGWDPNLVMLGAFAGTDPADEATYFGKSVYSGDTTGSVKSGVPELSSPCCG